jgi:hypothetical protein
MRAGAVPDARLHAADEKWMARQVALIKATSFRHRKLYLLKIALLEDWNPARFPANSKPYA